MDTSPANDCVQEIQVNHAGWDDVLLLNGDFFRRAATGCSGRVEKLQGGFRLLKWEDWNSEVLTPDFNVVPFEQYMKAYPEGCLKIEETSDNGPFSPSGHSTTKVCLLTYSKGRLSYLCTLISCMRNQTEPQFVHLLHLIGYEEHQLKFIESMIDGDPRFVVRRVTPKNQKEQLRRILSDARHIDAPFYVKIDDDDIYVPGFLDTILREAEGHHLTCGQSLLYHDSSSNLSWLEKQSWLFGNNMCFSSEAADFLLDSPDDDRWMYEDGQAHNQLIEGGYKINIFCRDSPPILYLRHGRNTTR